MRIRLIRVMKNWWLPLIVVLITVALPQAGIADSATDLDHDLIDAAKNGDPVLVKALLDKGADVNARGKDGGTPLMWTVYRGDLEGVELLLSRNADVNARDPGGKTPLMEAAARDYQWREAWY